jgi:hypothetical protein
MPKERRTETSYANSEVYRDVWRHSIRDYLRKVLFVYSLINLTCSKTVKDKQCVANTLYDTEK